MSMMFRIAQAPPIVIWVIPKPFASDWLYGIGWNGSITSIDRVGRVWRKPIEERGWNW